jgi:hypothetical protein
MEEGFMEESASRLSREELALEGGELLPDKEVLSVLDLFVNLDIGIDLAAPVDLAVAANANVAAPVDASASLNALAIGSTAGALAEQGTSIDQYISGEAIATAPQDAVIDQSNDVIDGGTGGGTGGDGTGGTGGDSSGNVITDPVGGATDGSLVSGQTLNGLLQGPLLNIQVDVALDTDLAAPIAGAVAANANVAAPIDAAVAANVLTINSDATAIAQQTAIINQSLDGVTAEATAEQVAEITQ